MSAPIATALRIRILNAFRLGQTSTVQLARRFAVSQPSVWRLLKRFKEEETIEPKGHGGGQPAMLTDRDLHRVKSMVDRQPELTADEISKKLWQQTKKRPSRPVIWRALKKLGYTRKKAIVRDQARKRPDVVKRREMFLKAAKGLNPRKLVFLDETGINGGFRPLTGWVPHGLSPVTCRPTTCRKNHTVIGAIREAGPVARKSLRGGMKKKDFSDFIRNLLGPRLHRGDVLVLDNLASHRNHQIVTLFRGFGAKVLFLPPYSPELNPIEMVWSTFKHRFSRRFRATVQRIKRALGGAWRSLRDLNFARYLPPCGYRDPIQCKG